MKGIKTKLAVMNFLEFAVWGSYLTCLGNYLGPHGLGTDIAWFYSVQGIVSIFMPAIMGMIADRYVQPQKLLGYCQFCTRSEGLDTVKDFPPIRVLGTVGFIAAMWFVNCFYISDGSVGFSLSNPLGPDANDPRFQYGVNQLITSAILSFVLFFYCMTLPKCAIV